jgi:pimeloyl-ACP methyl ester carboxylesterase
MERCVPPFAQTHYTPRSLKAGKDSRARWAIRPSGVAVVFVHGFGGAATATWDEFADRLPEHPECAGHDLLFYGYDSLTVQAPVSAALLRKFLHALATDPVNSVMAGSLSIDRGLGAAFRYHRIVILAHSLGAVVVREALIQAAGDPVMRPWIPLVRLALFAPAHCGARVTELAEEAIGAFKLSWLKLAASGYKAYAQVLKDLEEGSATLRRLEKETTALIDAGLTALRAEVVVQGERDRIVNQAVFCSDPGPEVELGMGHTAVCKPSAAYQAPIDYVLPILTAP